MYKMIFLSIMLVASQVIIFTIMFVSTDITNNAKVKLSSRSQGKDHIVGIDTLSYTLAVLTLITVYLILFTIPSLMMLSTTAAYIGFGMVFYTAALVLLATKVLTEGTSIGYNPFSIKLLGILLGIFYIAYFLKFLLY